MLYVFLADSLGAGRESEAFQVLTQISPNAVPNAMVVRLGDRELGRNGALLAPVKALNQTINEAISKWKL